MLKRIGLGFVVVASAFLGSYRPARAQGSGDWSMYGADASGSRYNSDEKSLGASNVGNLQVLWKVATSSIVSGTPVVTGNRVFAAEYNGNVYALDAKTGAIIWQTTIPGAGFTSTATVMRGRVVIGDQATGNIYGLNQGNGKLLWTIKPNASGSPGIWGSGTQVGKNLAIGVASNEELNGTTDFKSRGSVVLLDPQDGTVIWQTYTISNDNYSN